MKYQYEGTYLYLFTTSVDLLVVYYIYWDLLAY